MCFIDRSRGRARLGAGIVALLLAGCASSPMPRWETPGGAGRAEPGAPASAAARSWEEYRWRAALRLVEANPDGTYTGEVPEPLLAIPVLEVELNADGSVRAIEVLRVPKAGHTETVQMAIDAVRRAAPFGDVSRLPKPWRFTEAFLYDDAKRFKPRTLDQ